MKKLSGNSVSSYLGLIATRPKTCPVFTALPHQEPDWTPTHPFNRFFFHLCHVQEQWKVWFPLWSNFSTNKRGLRQHNLDQNRSLRWFRTHGCCWLQLKLQPQSLCWPWSVKRTERGFYCFFSQQWPKARWPLPAMQASVNLKPRCSSSSRPHTEREEAERREESTVLSHRGNHENVSSFFCHKKSQPIFSPTTNPLLWCQTCPPWRLSSTPLSPLSRCCCLSEFGLFSFYMEFPSCSTPSVVPARLAKWQ